jgi:hypothetical protein
MYLEAHRCSVLVVEVPVRRLGKNKWQGAIIIIIIVAFKNEAD